MIWRVTDAASPRFGIQSWDSPTPAQTQADALNRVLSVDTVFVSHEPCGRRPMFGTPSCGPHSRGLDNSPRDEVPSAL